MNLVKKICMMAFLFLGSHDIFASSMLDISCPSVEQLKLFHLSYINTTGFDRTTQHSNFFASLDEYEESFTGSWSLEIEPMQATKGENLETIITETIAKLEPVSVDPFNFESSYSYGRVRHTPVCIYIVPGNNLISAIAKMNAD